jgi:heme/copper-type cytochrome/quinol oxidase subunit 3
MEASAPLAPHIEPEPHGWQPRALWVTARLLCGAASFFFLAFVFAYFYLRSLDVNKAWKIGSVHPSVAFGVIIAVVLVASAVLMRMSTARPTEGLPLAAAALGLALLSVVLQVIDWTTLGFGPASGAYASVGPSCMRCSRSPAFTGSRPRWRVSGARAVRASTAPGAKGCRRMTSSCW